LLPNAKLLFLLRNPVDRLYSHYNFARGKLELPENLGFEEFLDLCAGFRSGELSAQAAGIAEKHLRALEIGEYAAHLKKYVSVFPVDNIKTVFFEHLNRNPVCTMKEIARFAGITPDFYESFEFRQVNTTFSAKRKPLHHLAMALNRGLESVLRQRPELKTRLVALYKRFNQGSEGYVPMTDTARARLVAYYAPTRQELKSLLHNQELPNWIA
jgi:hypothetical protein